MPYVPLEKIYQEGKSVYRLVLAAATRANELAQGAQPLIKTDSHKVSTIALEEVANEKVSYDDEKKKSKKG